MKKIAVIGVGAIGGLLGSYLTRGGYDVTIISCFRRENAEYMAEHGIDVDGAYFFHYDLESKPGEREINKAKYFAADFIEDYFMTYDGERNPPLSDIMSIS